MDTGEHAQNQKEPITEPETSHWEAVIPLICCYKQRGWWAHFAQRVRRSPGALELCRYNFLLLMPSGVNLVWNQGSWIWVKKRQFFQANWWKFSILGGKLTKHFDFSWQTDEKFRFCLANWRKISISFQAKISKWPFYLVLIIYSKISVYQDKICHLQINSRQIILFRLKSHHFRTYFLYISGS